MDHEILFPKVVLTPRHILLYFYPRLVSVLLDWIVNLAILLLHSIDGQLFKKHMTLKSKLDPI